MMAAEVSPVLLFPGSADVSQPEPPNPITPEAAQAAVQEFFGPKPSDPASLPSKTDPKSLELKLVEDQNKAVQKAGEANQNLDRVLNDKNATPEEIERARNAKTKADAELAQKTAPKQGDTTPVTADAPDPLADATKASLPETGNSGPGQSPEASGVKSSERPASNSNNNSPESAQSERAATPDSGSVEARQEAQAAVADVPDKPAEAETVQQLVRSGRLQRLREVEKNEEQRLRLLERKKGEFDNKAAAAGSQNSVSQGKKRAGAGRLTKAQTNERISAAQTRSSESVKATAKTTATDARDQVNRDGEQVTEARKVSRQSRREVNSAQKGVRGAFRNLAAAHASMAKLEPDDDEAEGAQRNIAQAQGSLLTAQQELETARQAQAAAEREQKELEAELAASQSEFGTARRRLEGADEQLAADRSVLATDQGRTDTAKSEQKELSVQALKTRNRLLTVLGAREEVSGQVDEARERKTEIEDKRAKTEDRTFNRPQAGAA